MTPYEHLASEIADLATQRVVRATIRCLQGLREGLQFGDDSGLTSIWDEVCVQIQTERLLVWWAYEDTIRSVICTEVKRLAPYELKAIWLDTRAGEEWAEKMGVGEKPCYCLDDVEDRAYSALLSTAANYTNERIRAFIHR